MGLEAWEFSILYFLQALRTPFLDKVVPAFSSLGNAGLCFIVLGVILLCMRKTRKTGILILLSLLTGLIIGNLGIKNLVMRSRPCWLDQSIPLLIESPRDFSFPSGHTLAAFETAFAVYFTNKRWGIPMFIFAVLMGLSRLYLFVHFPTDVLSGMALAFFIVWFLDKILEKTGLYDILRLSK